jgi:hypothetical protein
MKTNVGGYRPLGRRINPQCLKYGHLADVIPEDNSWLKIADEDLEYNPQKSWWHAQSLMLMKRIASANGRRF